MSGDDDGWNWGWSGGNSHGRKLQGGGGGGGGYSKSSCQTFSDQCSGPSGHGWKAPQSPPQCSVCPHTCGN